MLLIIFAPFDYGVKRGGADINSSKNFQFSMQFTGETLTAVTHQSQLEAVTMIMQSLTNPKTPIKKLRHSLKNLCFYKPTSNFLNSLTEILKREMKDPTKCFKLVCYHLISHSFLAQTSQNVPPLLDHISKYLNGKDINEDADLIFRVYFHLSAYIPSYHQNLIETISHLLSIPPKEITKSTKKGIFGKETTSPLEPLVREVIALLVDLPDFEINAPKLLTDDLVEKLVALQAILPQPSKEHLLHFLGRLPTIPPSLQCLLSTKSITSLETVGYIAKCKDQYTELITSTVADEKSPVAAALKYELAKLGCNDQFLVDAILNKFKGDFNSMMPLFELKIRSVEIPIDSVATTLYVTTSNTNITLAFLAYSLLVFHNTDKKWLYEMFKNLSASFQPEIRTASLQRLAVVWKAFIKTEEDFKNLVVPMLITILREYTDAVDPKAYECFVKSIAEKGLSNAYLETCYSMLDNLPSVDTVIYLFYSASLLQATASPAAFQAFKTKAENYLLSADPSLQPVYKTLILKQ